MSRSSPRSRRCIWNSSARSRRSPTPRRRSFAGSSRAARRCSIATTRSSRAWRRPRRAAGVRASSSFGEHAEADARLVKVSLQAESSTVQAHILGADVTYKLGAPGRHRGDQLARGAGGRALARRRSRARGAGARRSEAAGRARRAHHARAARRRRAADRRELQRQPGLDARRARAARPGADDGHAAGASRCSATCWNSAPKAPSCIAASPMP